VGDPRNLERALGVRFPDDYRAFLASSGSLLIQVHEDIWPRPEAGSIGPHWMQTRFELSAFGVCSEVDWMRVEVEAARPFLEELIRGRRVIAVGRLAATELGSEYVRHPSYGGALAFAQGVRRRLER